MSTAFRIVDVIAEAQYIFVELIYILKCYFHGDIFVFPFIINHIVNRFLGLVHILDKANYAFRFPVLHTLCRSFSLIFVNDG